MSKILAIDPGDTYSAYVLYDTETKMPIEFAKIPNHDMLIKISKLNYSDTNKLAVEMIASYGMAVGASVFETCVWVGRYTERFRGDVTQVYRKDVKMHLCKSMKAKDSNIRQAIIDLYPKTGKNSKGSPCAIGTKKFPGTLYGLSADCWAALGVAITYAETMLK